MFEVPKPETWRNPTDIIVSMVGIGGEIQKIETIEHDGNLWLVPEWIAHDEQGWMRPSRIVSLETIQHERSEAQEYSVVVNEGLPSDLMPPNDPLETAKRTLVIDLPDIWFAIPVAN